MKRNLYIFRNNLRLHDNPSLKRAIEESDELQVVYFLPKAWNEQIAPLGLPRMSDKRKAHLVQCLKGLSKSLKKHNIPFSILPYPNSEDIKCICEELNILNVYTSKEPGTEEANFDALFNFKNLIQENDNSLFEPNGLPFEIDKTPFIYTEFRKKVEKYGSLRSVADDTTFNIHFLDLIKGIELPEFNESIGGTNIPEGFHEEEALWNLSYYTFEQELIKTYKETRNGLIGRDYSSKFSLFLSLGTLSPRKIWEEVNLFETSVAKSQNTYWLKFELLWREFFRWQLLKHNELFFLKGGIRQLDPSYFNSINTFKDWVDGNTGQDFVDANMKELAQTGFMSNRGRQNVASYLIHDLNTDWRWGAQYFEHALLDYDCASNWGNWMYIAGVGNDPRFRKFNLQLQSDRYDTDGSYRRYWLQ